jgi:cell pole-organizing protein PopZ
MQTPREPSMEDILASIKRVIAEEKEVRSAIPQEAEDAVEEDDILELDETMEALPVENGAPASIVDLGPPLIDEDVADDSRARLAELSSVAASVPPAPATNPLEDILKDMLRPALKQWLDENLPRIVDEHVKREISRITGKPL